MTILWTLVFWNFWKLTCNILILPFWFKFPVLFLKAPLDPEKVDRIDEALGHVDRFLQDGFIAGSELSIADFSMAVILSTLEASGHDLSNYSEIPGYLEKCAGLMKGWETNMRGAGLFGDAFKAMLAEAEG